ncbi:MAG: hypothetical protein WBZ36_31305 [Candidatus Nitrosopolaris sp.]
MRRSRKLVIRIAHYDNVHISLCLRCCRIRIHDTLEENGIDTILVNPYKTKIIAEAKIKSDKLDARILADLLRTDLVYESYVPTKEFREKERLFDPISIAFLTPPDRLTTIHR